MKKAGVTTCPQSHPGMQAGIVGLCREQATPVSWGRWCRRGGSTMAHVPMGAGLATRQMGVPQPPQYLHHPPSTHRST